MFNSSMLTPGGEPAENTDKVMLLSMWATTLESERKLDRVINAGMGKPTYHINQETVNAYLQYWQQYAVNSGNSKGLNVQGTDAKSAGTGSKVAIAYGDPRGKIDNLQIMAEALSRWYSSPGHSEVIIKPENLLFTTGGVGAIRAVFDTFNELYKDTNYRLVTPVPHYTMYADNTHVLHPIHVMDEPGYRLTAKALEASIQSAYELAKKDNIPPKAVLLCNPSNPLGTVINEDELKKIADVLRKYPDLTLVLDEAYSEMYWKNDRIPSFLQLAPDLRERIVIFRSATKALSAAGERLAVLIGFSKKLMTKFCEKTIRMTGHAALSAQYAYAMTMKAFSKDDQIALKNHYLPKVEYIFNELKRIGAEMPDPLYSIDGTFYVLGDFSDLIGQKIPKEASNRALNRVGKIQNDEDIAYSLLFEHSLALSPCSYNGVPGEKGILRITCSDEQKDLNNIISRLEKALTQARLNTAGLLKSRIDKHFAKLGNTTQAKKLSNAYKEILKNDGSCKSLKIQNKALKNLLVDLRKIIPEEQMKAAGTLTKFFRNSRQKLQDARGKKELQEEWIDFINDMFIKECPTKNYFLNLSPEERLNYKPWIDHLHLKNNQSDAPMVR